MTTTLEAVDLPFQEAVDFFRAKVPEHTQHWTDVWRTAHSRAFMVAGAASDALLSDFKSAIDKALRQGTTLAEFRADFDGIVARHGWVHNGSAAWRSRIIYETNLSTAFSAGQYAQMTEPATLEAFPFWQYVHSGSAHPRLQHLAWNGLTLRADDPFWTTHYPPNGWHCGCRARPISARGLGRMGKTRPDTAPPAETRPWRNPHTGEVHQVPVGIDPGFDYNPGAAWKRGAGAIPTKTADFDELAKVAPRTPTPAAPVVAGPAATPEALRQFLEDPKGSVVAGGLPGPARETLKTTAADVLLSADTIEKQGVRHGELTPEDYLALPALLGNPDLVMAWPGGRVALLRAIAGAPRTGRGSVARLAILKATQDGQEVYLVSLHRLRRKSLAQALRRGTPVAGDADALR